jgi:ribosomal protein L37AE/L43A
MQHSTNNNAARKDAPRFTVPAQHPGACGYCGNVCDLRPGAEWTCPHCGVTYKGAEKA